MKKRKAGRPKKNKDEKLVSITVDIDQTTRERLLEIMKVEDRSFSLLCRKLLREGVELWKTNQ